MRFFANKTFNNNDLELIIYYNGKILKFEFLDHAF